MRMPKERQQRPTGHAVVIAGGGPTGLMLAGELRLAVRGGGFDITPWADRVQSSDAKYVDVWELPLLGVVTAPAAVLIWFGAPTSAIRAMTRGSRRRRGA